MLFSKVFVYDFNIRVLVGGQAYIMHVFIYLLLLLGKPLEELDSP